MLDKGPVTADEGRFLRVERGRPCHTVWMWLARVRAIQSKCGHFGTALRTMRSNKLGVKRLRSSAIRSLPSAPT